MTADPETREPRTEAAIRVLAHREWWEWLPEATQMSRVRDLSDVFLAIEDQAATEARRELDVDVLAWVATLPSRYAAEYRRLIEERSDD